MCKKELWWEKKLVLKKEYWLFYVLTFFAGARRQIFIVFAGFLLVEKFGVLPKAKMAELAIPKSNIVFMKDDEMQSQMESILNILFEELQLLFKKS